MRMLVRTLVLLAALLIYAVLKYRPKPELFIVPAIILLVLTLVTPYVISQREQARQQHHMDKFRQLGYSLQSYYDTHQRFPTVASPTPRPTVASPGPQPVVTTPRPQPAIRQREPSDELISPL